MEGAHISFDDVVKDFPSADQGKKPAGAPHTPWQLLEHIRIAQADILEFSRNAKHKSPKWPEGYWPKSEAPPNDAAWDKSVSAFRHDLDEMKKLVVHATDEQLYAPILHGDGQTLLREALLVADHNSYHLGQLMFVKKMLESSK
jgi:hypothetical protein